MSEKSSKDAPAAGVPVLVTTDKRGVFFGFANPAELDVNRPSLTLTRGQMVIRWSADMQGIVGLVSRGPSESCRISPAAGTIQINGITSIMMADPEDEQAVVDAFLAQPWGNG